MSRNGQESSTVKQTDSRQVNPLWKAARRPPQNLTSSCLITCDATFCDKKDFAELTDLGLWRRGRPACMVQVVPKLSLPLDERRRCNDRQEGYALRMEGGAMSQGIPWP